MGCLRGTSSREEMIDVKKKVCQQMASFSMTIWTCSSSLPYPDRCHQDWQIGTVTTLKSTLGRRKYRHSSEQRIPISRVYLLREIYKRTTQRQEQAEKRKYSHCFKSVPVTSQLLTGTFSLLRPWPPPLLPSEWSTPWQYSSCIEGTSRLHAGL